MKEAIHEYTVGCKKGWIHRKKGACYQEKCGDSNYWVIMDAIIGPF